MIIGTKFSTKMFFYHKEDNEFSQEASTLGTGFLFLSRLYDDACDEGFVLESHRTGKKIPFYLTGIERDSEGDILCWNFKAVAERLPVSRKAKELTATVFND